MIWFSDRRNFVEKLSRDQDFGTHRMMSDCSGNFAQTFDVSGLKGSELDDLRRYAVVVKSRCT
jgi:hypothetical protein